MNKHKKPHFPADDRLARFTFSDTRRAAGLFREFLPEDLLACLELEGLKLLPEQHIGRHLKERRDDLNFSCPLKNGGNAVLRILVEHKSEFDRQLWFQLLDSILLVWKKEGMKPVIPVVLHTGPAPFVLASPRYLLDALPSTLKECLPELPIGAIDLASTAMERLLGSIHLDEVAKLVLGIMKLIQLKQLDLASVRSLTRTLFPHAPTQEQRLYLDAAITYIHYKAPERAELTQDLRKDMALAHPIHPESAFARELREERQKGIDKGLELGIEQGIERGLELDKLDVIVGMLAKGCDWSFIESITHLDQAGYEALKIKHGK